ncbi:MAG: ParB/RepB/Spo0J family partition protein [Flavobacteriaceae bacterium]|tara:strand:+ start:4610 stop:5494 length:885 start_codon:yes stop_codon:yes gene_type:complete
MNKSKKKSALGRGLSVLLNNSDSYSVDTNPNDEKIKVGVVSIPIKQIATNPYQPRSNFSDENIDELAESIKNLGIIQPITVRKIENGEFQLIAGERRLRASKKIGLKTIASFIKNSNDEEMLEIALVENIQRKDLDPIEIAISVKRLIDELSLTQDQLSKKLGKKRSTISNYIRLLRLDPIIQTGIRDGFLSMGHGRSIINIEDKNIQLRVYKDIIRKELSVRKTEILVRKIKENKIPKKSLKKINNFLNEEKYFSKILGSKIQIITLGNNKGFLKIPFNSKSELLKLKSIFKT